MPNEQRDDIKDHVMTMIARGDVRMRSRWVAALGSFAMAIGLSAAALVIVYTTSIISFSLRTHGPMGPVRFQELLAFFPWWAIALALVGIGVGIWLLRKLDFSYRVPFLWVFLGIVCSLIFLGWLADLTGVDVLWSHVGPMGGMMRSGVHASFFQSSL